MNVIIETLRQDLAKQSEAAPRQITLEQARGVVDGLVGITSLADIATATGLTEDEVLDVVKRLGTWLTHVHGGSNATLVKSADVGQMPLLQIPASPEPGAKKRNKPTEPAANKRKKAAERDERVVTIPAGFEPRAPHKRDVRKALASIVVHRPDNTSLVRWISREYPSETKMLTYTAITAAWNFAHFGVLDKLSEIAPNPGFMTVLLQAYDTLDVARLDAIDGLRTLARGDVSDLQVLANACAKCRFIAEGEIVKIERCIDIVAAETADLVARSVDLDKTRPSSESTLLRELRWLAERVRVQPRRYMIEDVGNMQPSQVLRIAQMAGVPVEGGNRQAEAEIRERLAALSLSADADRLVPEGLRAARLDLLEEFYEALDRRADGDPNWNHVLQRAFATASA